MERGDKPIEQHIIDVLSTCDSKSRMEMIATIRRIIDSELLKYTIEDSDISCPGCGSSDHILYGRTRKGTQRYQCSCCHKVYAVKAGSIIGNTKLPYEKWTQYAECFVDHLPSSAVCRKLGVCMKTAWFMRVRVLEALYANMPSFQVKSGLGVEVDELYFNESFKGTRFDSFQEAPREPRSNSRSLKRGISNDKICVLTAFDDAGDFFFDIVCRGALTHDIAVDSLKERITSGAIVNTDDHRAYPKVMKELDVAVHNAVKAKEDGCLSRLNCIHQDIRTFMSPFKGVSTKWLGLYIGWYKWLRSFNHEASVALKQICRGSYIHTWRSIRDMPFPFRDGCMNELKC